jgi:hypothetical protein
MQRLSYAAILSRVIWMARTPNNSGLPDLNKPARNGAAPAALAKEIQAGHFPVVKQ